MKNLIGLEQQRQAMQCELDSKKSMHERNAMGQYATPITLADAMLEQAKTLIPQHKEIRFLDPAFGTGVFFSALNNAFSPMQIQAAQAYEIDPHYGHPASTLWEHSDLKLHLKDFTQAAPPIDEKNKFNLILCNPPYVRHQHINGQKERLHTEAYQAANMNLSKLAGLYCYFIALTHRWMAQDGVAGWLLPSEFMDVNYGQAIKHYLLTEVTLLQIHRFNPCDVQFNDALVSSAIVWFQRKKPHTEHSVKFTWGGSVVRPKKQKNIPATLLKNERKWTRFPHFDARIDNNIPTLCDFFTIKRGIATGYNRFFILSRDEINQRNLPIDYFLPILPSPRYLRTTEIDADIEGNPLLEKQLFVLNCKLPLNKIRIISPSLHTYLQEGIERGVSERYLCKHRKLWYAQETRPKSYFYCTYMGRSDKYDKKPFRFILNRSNAIVANSYLILYPNQRLENAINENPHVGDTILAALNQITSRSLIDEGRVYGGGMYKIEPRELANVPAIALSQLIQ